MITRAIDRSHRFGIMYFCERCGMALKDVVNEDASCRAAENVIAISERIALRRMEDLVRRVLVGTY